MPYRSASVLRPWELAGCVAYYQPVSAPSPVHAVQNMAQGRLGTYTATPGVAPTWNARTGWTFNGSSQYLVTGLIASTSHTTLAQFNSAALNGVIFGGRTSSTVAYWYAYPRISSLGTRYAIHNAQADNATATISGNLGLVGGNGYKDGLFDKIVTSGTFVGTYPYPIGCFSAAGSMSAYFGGAITAFAAYSRILTASEMWQAALQMKYCNVNPDWNAWARRRRYYIVPAAVGLRWPVIGPGIVGGKPVSPIGGAR